MFVNLHNVLTVEGREIWEIPAVCASRVGTCARARVAEANMKFTPVTYAKNSKVKSEAGALPFFCLNTWLLNFTLGSKHNCILFAVIKMF